jgi:hypothetical protein
VTTRPNRTLRALAAIAAAFAATLGVAITAYASTADPGHGPADTGPATANSGLALSAARTSTTTYDSLHWAGYTFPVGHVTGVSADWTEPRVTGKKGQEEFVWLGIGGWGVKDDNIIQEGTFVWFPSSRQRNEGVWYELVPLEDAQSGGMRVGPGNRIRASITELSARKHTWRLVVDDVTSGGRWTKNLTFKSLEVFPSFVVEDPDKGSSSPNGPFFPFPRWTPVTFTHVAIRAGSRWISAARFPMYRINMVRGRDTLATTGAMSRQSSFTVTDR